MSEQRTLNVLAEMFSILLIAVLIWDRKHHMLHCSDFYDSMQWYSISAPLLMVMYQILSGDLLLLSIGKFDHKETAGHNAAINLIAEAEVELLENLCLKGLSHKKLRTVKIFHIAYKVAKENQCFHDI
jgi:hypothetical protein